MKLQNNQKKLIASLVFNITIFICMIIGIIIYVTAEKCWDGWKVLRFFTYQSNIVMGIISLIYSIFVILILTNKLKTIPKQLELVKLMTTVGVVLTFVTVMCVLGPSSKFAKELFIYSCAFYHVIIPLLSLLTFILFEHSDHKYYYPETWYGIIHVVAYAIFYLTQGLLNMKDGKVPSGHDWYGFFNIFGVKLCWLCVILMLGTAYLISWLLWLANKKINLFPAKEIKKNNKKVKA